MKQQQNLCHKLSISGSSKYLNFEIIDRKNWYKLSKLKNKWIFNATPIEVNMVDNNVIDGRPFTQEGKIIALNQAINQFKIYTGIDYDE